MPRQAVDSLWLRFSSVTRARIALGRAGDALPTARLLEFAYAHASARDAVAAAVDFAAVATQMLPMTSVLVKSAAPDRSTYLRRPDLGRQLSRNPEVALPHGPFDAVFVVADGLSANAVQAHAAPLLKVVMPRLAGWNLGPVVLAEQARVALGDEIGAQMGASLVVVVIGERPGLSVPNSLGLYLTYAPCVGRRDSERNCISNIHADGLSYSAAADTLIWLMNEARQRNLTGVALKEAASDAPAALPVHSSAKNWDGTSVKLRRLNQQQGD